MTQSLELNWGNKEWHELTEEDILEANIKKYENDDIVRLYDDDQQVYDIEYLEHEIIFPVLVNYLQEKHGTPLSAIDVCGGAGKAAFILHSCGGCQTILLDTAQKMLDIAHRKMHREKVESITPVRHDAIGYLQETENSFDIIVFSSAIHHFKHPTDLLKLAFNRLSPHGVMVVLGEPTNLVSSKRYRRAISTYAFLMDANTRRNFWKSIPQRLAGTYQPPDERDPAEYQAYQGIDDHALRKELAKAGMHTLLHINYPAGGPPHIVRLQSYLGLNWVMGLVITREPDNILKARLEQAVRQQLPYKITIL